MTAGRPYSVRPASQAKRIADVAIATTALACLAPLISVAAVAIRFDSPGPILYRQTRLGKDAQPFVILKLRTMHHRSTPVDQLQEAVLSEGRDPRITRLGRVLRSTSIDELPQLINVLRGDMSLVGPRPLLPDQKAAVPWHYEGRFLALPGITGLAQVSGRRNLDWMEQLRLDLEYVEQQSYRLDWHILLRTILTLHKSTTVYGTPERNWRSYLTNSSAE